MPISAANRLRYPPEWPEISLSIRHHAGWKCQHCGIARGEPTRKGGKNGGPIVLTVAHLHDPAPENCSLGNLAALCQSCHFRTHRERDRVALDTPDLFA